MNENLTNKAQEEVVDEKEKSALQKILDIPIIGGFIALIIGLVPPALIIVFIFPGKASADDLHSVYENFSAASLIFLWNAVLFFIFRINITTPLIPIPLFIIGLLGMIYQIYRYFTI